MATTKLQSVEVANPQVSQKKKSNGTSAPIRVRQKTKVKLEQLLKQANKDRMGRRIYIIPPIPPMGLVVVEFWY
jgi:hypothetical protein